MTDTRTPGTAARIGWDADTSRWIVGDEGQADMTAAECTQTGAIKVDVARWAGRRLGPGRARSEIGATGGHLGVMHEIGPEHANPPAKKSMRLMDAG